MNQDLIFKCLRYISYQSTKTKSFENLLTTKLKHQSCSIFPSRNSLVYILVLKYLQQSLFVDNSLSFGVRILNRRKPLFNLSLIVNQILILNFKKVLNKLYKILIARIVFIENQMVLIILLTLLMYEQYLFGVILDNLKSSKKSFVFVKLDLL